MASVLPGSSSLHPGVATRLVADSGPGVETDVVSSGLVIASIEPESVPGGATSELGGAVDVFWRVVVVASGDGRVVVVDVVEVVVVVILSVPGVEDGAVSTPGEHAAAKRNSTARTPIRSPTGLISISVRRAPRRLRFLYSIAGLWRKLRPLPTGATMPDRRSLLSLATVFSLTMTLVVVGPGVEPALAAPGDNFVDINPDASDNGNRNSTAGGRVNGLASASGNSDVFYAASEWGGLYKTTDGAASWSRLNSHLPVAMWDVEVDPGNNNRVYATSFFDGKEAPVSGIQVSTDAGATWGKPGTANPPAGYQCAAARIDEPSAFGIAIRPDAPANVFIGTNCGVARSTDSGATWTFIDPKKTLPTPIAGNAANVWDVVAQAGGIVDICGDEGHWRSTNNGNTWQQGAGLPTGICSIAASPDEDYVLYAVSGTTIFETFDGNTWSAFAPANPSANGRIPFLETNPRSGNDGRDYDLWFGDRQLHTIGCTTPETPATGGSTRCSGAWATNSSGSHDDAGALAFDTTVAEDGCPLVYSSDGGVHTNTDDTSPGCHAASWNEANVGMHALWLYAMTGADQAGDSSEDIYMGAQDTGSFATTNGGAANPTWTMPNCCDVFNIVADSSRVIWDRWSPYLFLRGGSGMSGSTNINGTPPGVPVQGFALFNFPDYLDQYSANGYVAVSGQGLFITTDITANPVTWTELGASGGAGGGYCGVQAADDGGTPVFYAQTQCIGVFETSPAAQLWKFEGTNPSGTWERVDNNDGISGGFGIFAVDPNDADRLYASNLAGTEGAQMVFSTDGGDTWDVDTELNDYMDGFGDFEMQTAVGPTSFTRFGGYVQPSLVVFDPEDPDVIVAGGRDSGVFLSTDSGANWSLLTDPRTSGSSSVPHLPRPWFAYFDHEPASQINIYIGTQGRGVWRIELTPPEADAGGPYTTDEGVDVTLDASASTGNGPLTYEWDLDDDGDFDDGTGVTTTFELVGQDGVFEVAVKVTDQNGAFDVATSTVTVANVDPSVGLASDAPVDENSPVTVTGVVSDPGWLEDLTADIDWGDGSPVEPISGILENVRPDATLTFSISHIYGDNGTFTAEVCGHDDDSTTCAEIDLQVDNVDPTAEIDETDTVLINGIPTFLAHAGEDIEFSGRSTDPGSDDLALSWDWDDGPPSPDVTTIYLVNPPNPDPFPSPSIQPRDVTDTQTHAFEDACLYLIVFSALDDDGGTGDDSAQVLIVGNADDVRTMGFWRHQFRQIGRTHLTVEELNCYLEIVNFVSTVFDEEVALSTFDDAVAVLTANAKSMLDQLDAQLLAVLLNFANGAVEWDQLIDTDGDSVGDTPFHEVIAHAEAVRNNPASTRAELEAQKDILEAINLGTA